MVRPQCSSIALSSWQPPRLRGGSFLLVPSKRKRNRESEKEREEDRERVRLGGWVEGESLSVRKVCPSTLHPPYLLLQPPHSSTLFPSETICFTLLSFRGYFSLFFSQCSIVESDNPLYDILVLPYSHFATPEFAAPQQHRINTGRHPNSLEVNASFPRARRPQPPLPSTLEPPSFCNHQPPRSRSQTRGRSAVLPSATSFSILLLHTYTPSFTNFPRPISTPRFYVTCVTLLLLALLINEFFSKICLKKLWHSIWKFGRLIVLIPEFL